MKASELRIGNYIFVNVDSMVKVIGIKHDSIDTAQLERESPPLTKYDRLTLDNVSPIPLTEEWLKKFGFNKDIGFHTDLYAVKAEGYWGLYIDLENKLFYIEGGEWAHSAPCQYVHQLQNLYFALTGTELEIIV